MEARWCEVVLEREKLPSGHPRLREERASWDEHQHAIIKCRGNGGSRVDLQQPKSREAEPVDLASATMLFAVSFPLSAAWSFFRGSRTHRCTEYPDADTSLASA